MKIFLMLSLIGFWTSVMRGQGTVLFYNYDSPYMDAPVYDSDRVTAVFGPQFTAALFAGPSSNSLAQVATARFIRAGYYFNGIQAISTVSPGSTAWIQVQVWNTQSGASFAQAQASGLPDSWWESGVFTVPTGGAAGGGGPIPAAALIGLGTSPVFLNGLIPEPSTSSLLVMGGLAPWYRSRRGRRRTSKPQFFARHRVGVGWTSIGQVGSVASEPRGVGPFPNPAGLQKVAGGRSSAETSGHAAAKHQEHPRRGCQTKNVGLRARISCPVRAARRCCDPCGVDDRNWIRTPGVSLPELLNPAATLCEPCRVRAVGRGAKHRFSTYGRRVSI